MRHRSPVSTILAATASAALIVTVTACSPNDETAETGCASTVHDASLAVEVADQIRLLDQAMVRCTSLGELTGEMRKYPGITG